MQYELSNMDYTIWIKQYGLNKLTRWRRFICKVLIHFIDAISFPLVVLLFYAIFLLVWIILMVTNAPDFCGYIAQADSTSVT